MGPHFSYDATQVANLAATNELYEEAVAVYKKFGVFDAAIKVGPAALTTGWSC
jgi:hypothetical protein